MDKSKRIVKSELPLYVNDFLFYLEIIAGRSTNTVYEYYLDLRNFLRFISINKNYVVPEIEFDDIIIKDFTIEQLKEISLSDVYEYMHFLSKERSNENVTRSRKVSSLKSFFRYLATKTNYEVLNPLENLEMPSIKKSLPKYLSLEESLELLDAVKGRYKERDYCMLTLFLNCGLRLSELVNISLNDISKNTIKILGKGNKERLVYINDACIDSIENYKKVRPKKAKEQHALFISRNGNRITNRRVQQIVDQNLVEAGLDGKGFSTHKLRHTAATLMYQHGGVDIRVLKEILGHENISTTEIYTHVSSEQLEKASKKSPLSNIKRK